VLVVSGGGQVGGALLEALGPDGVGTFSTDPFPRGQQLDLRAAPAALETALAALLPAGASALVYAGGMTQVDLAEGQRELAFALNRDVPALLARWAVRRQLGFACFSTDYVFDGAAGPYDERAAPHPLSVYGESKLAGEVAVQEANPDALVIRTTGVYGPEWRGRNFAFRVAAAVHDGGGFSPPEDQLSTPTYNRDLARATLALVRDGLTGVVHLAGHERMGRATLARRLAHAAGLPTSGISDGATEEAPGRARRPLSAGLVSVRVPHLAGSFRTIEAAVADWRTAPRGKPWP